MRSKHIFIGAIILSAFLIVGIYITKSEDEIQAEIEQSSEELTDFSEAYFPDSDIETAVQTALAMSSEVAVLNIEVESVKNTIILKGTVDSAEVKARAANVALNTEGVEGVDNQLEIRERGVDDSFDPYPTTTSPQ